MVLGTSLFILGYVPGPIIFAPLSEMFGRRTVLLPMFVFLCLSAGTATSDRLEGVLITRFFAGQFPCSYSMLPKVTKGPLPRRLCFCAFVWTQRARNPRRNPDLSSLSRNDSWWRACRYV